MKHAPSAPTGRPSSTAPASLAGRPGATQRSRVTNGTSLHLGPVGGNTAEARRFRDLVSAFQSEAGLTTPTEAQIGLCRRCAAATCQLEALEATLARGEDVDPLAYTRIDGVLRRARRDLGIGPAVADDAPPEDLDDVLEREGLERA